MKKIFLSLALTGLIAGAALAQGETPATKPMSDDQTTTKSSANPAAFAFLKEVHDFGKQEEGPKYEHEFTFKNTGGEPLIIKNVRASCGCTTPVWPKEPIMPGNEAVVKAVYNSKGRVGNFNKAITITSNASTPTKVLYIKGTIVKAENTGMPMKKPSMMAEPDGKTNNY